MWADTEEELHEIADKIGLKRQWFQTGTIINHYDLVRSKRKMAIQLGAKKSNLKSFIKEKRTS